MRSFHSEAMSFSRFCSVRRILSFHLRAFPVNMAAHFLKEWLSINAKEEIPRVLVLPD